MISDEEFDYSIDVSIPTGEIIRIDCSSNWTVDKIKIETFRRAPSLHGYLPSHFHLATLYPIRNIFVVEFLKFKEVSGEIYYDLKRSRYVKIYLIDTTSVSDYKVHKKKENITYQYDEYIKTYGNDDLKTKSQPNEIQSISPSEFNSDAEEVDPDLEQITSEEKEQLSVSDVSPVTTTTSITSTNDTKTNTEDSETESLASTLSESTTLSTTQSNTQSSNVMEIESDELFIQRISKFSIEEQNVLLRERLLRNNRSTEIMKREVIEVQDFFFDTMTKFNTLTDQNEIQELCVTSFQKGIAKIRLIFDQSIRERFKVKDEFITSEKKFIVDVLDPIINTYYIPLEQSEILMGGEIDCIFSNLKIFTEQQKKFLTKCIQAHQIGQDIGSLVIERVNEMQNFSYVFIHKLSVSISMIRLLRKSNKKFRKFLQEREFTPLSSGTDLTSLLCKPVGRFGYYRLLISRYLKTFKEASPEYEKVSQICDEITEMLNTLNQQTLVFNQKETASELQQRQRPGGLYVDFVKPGRQFLHEGVLSIIDLEKKTRTLFHIYLCSDILVQAKISIRRRLSSGFFGSWDEIDRDSPVEKQTDEELEKEREKERKKKFTVSGVYSLRGATLISHIGGQIERNNTQYGSNRSLFRHAFGLVTVKRSIFFGCEKEEDKQVWVQYLNQCILETQHNMVKRKNLMQSLTQYS